MTRASVSLCKLKGLKMKMLNVALLATGLFVTPASADPLTDFLNRAFQNHQEGSQRAPRLRIAHHPRFAHRHVAGHGGGSVLASFYGGGERLNSHTACGQRFNPGGFTAAHRSLPCGTRLLVSHGSRSVVVTVNDRGPAAYTGRSLDLSRGAAAHLGFIEAGTAHVQIARLN